MSGRSHHSDSSSDDLPLPNGLSLATIEPPSSIELACCQTLYSFIFSPSYPPSKTPSKPMSCPNDGNTFGLPLHHSFTVSLFLAKMLITGKELLNL
ncbi:hypothetical protein ACSBR1_006191 [Camellia fascicularis]